MGQLRTVLRKQKSPDDKLVVQVKLPCVSSYTVAVEQR